MNYLSSQGIVHRDLAARNLLVSILFRFVLFCFVLGCLRITRNEKVTEIEGNYVVKISDFGLYSILLFFSLFLRLIGFV